MFQAILERLDQALTTETQPIPALKSAVAEAKEELAHGFHGGAETEQLIREHSDFMDAVISRAWRRYDWQENTTSWRKSRIALLAVGGYGRKELLPHSDIDLLILLERNNHSAHRTNIQSFTTLLWDIGLEVGHSVRSLSDCKSEANHDVTVMTAMMEARLLIGDERMQEKLEKQISAAKVWPAKKFYLAKRDEQDERHVKSDHTEYSLEPNLKTSPGGLRDIQTITWVARRQYGSRTFEELAEAGALIPVEAAQLNEARRHLWKIRFALHLLTGRDENRLLFEHQQKLAEQFGFEDGDQLAVEQFMQTYYRTAQQINTINRTILQFFDETIVQAKRRIKVKPINKRFQLANNYLEVTNPNVFRNEPSALLEMFAIVGDDDAIEGIRAGTIRLAKQHVHLIDDDFRANPKNAELFMELLGTSSHLFTQLRRMSRWGILGAYLPEFARVIGQMQFDLFHIYTVDAHTLQVVRNMRRFRYKSTEQKFPIAAHIHSRLPRIELLYIAGLYHDIAKGMGGDHSELGVGIAEQFCNRHQLPTWDTNLVCWLVQNHLVMSTTAQRKDIQDPEVVHEFARFVGDQVRLDYLYALTVADINATNPTLWNGWKDSLLRQLYTDTKRALRHGLETPIDRTDYIEDSRQQALARLTEHDFHENDVLALWDQVDDEYFIRERVTDIVSHAEAIIGEGINNEDRDNYPIILITDDRSRRSETGFTQIFIHTPDRKDLFVSIVSAIDHLNLDIVDARIATSAADLTFNTFTVLERDGQPVGDRPQRVDRIRQTITQYLNADDISKARRRRTSRALREFRYKTEVRVYEESNLAQTAIEVITPDRPGLLTIIAGVFVQLGISLVSAKISTLGERVEDVFYVTNQDGSAIRDEKLIETLRKEISEQLDQHVEQIAS